MVELAVMWPLVEVDLFHGSTLEQLQILGLEMLLHKCTVLYSACGELSDAVDWLTSAEVNPPDRQLNADDLAFIKRAAELLAQAIAALGIEDGGFKEDCTRVIDSVRSLGGGVWKGVFDVRADYLARDYRRVRDGLLAEIQKHKFLHLTTHEAELYLRPGEGFTETLISFPSATLDVEEACKCYALERYTACVFHAMAVLQVGLFVLAKDVGIALRFPLQLAEWGDILRAIQDKVKPYGSLPRGDALREKYDNLYSDCAAQFGFFKDAWRNHVAHSREVYDKDRSHSILEHVRHFMERLSTRLHE